MIIITSIGRSGTSFVTLWLKECGLKVGSDRWFDNFKAGMENKQTLDINARLIRHYVKGEDINLYHCYGDIDDLKFDVVKDTQFLVHEDIIADWWHVRKDIKVLWMHRKPKYIVQSMKKNPEWSTPVFRCFEDMIVEKCRTFEGQLNDLAIPWRLFMFPDILDKPEELIESGLFDGIQLPDDAVDIWNNLRDDIERNG